MPNVFKSLATEAGVFRSEDALSPEFIPDSLPGREAQEKEIALALRPAAEGKRASNLFVFGPSGTGKTSTCKRVLEQLNDFSSKPLCIYVNCWQHATRQGVFTELAHGLDEALPRRGLAADEVFERVCHRLKRDARVPVVVLDECDRLFASNEDKVLYDLTRASENYGVNFGALLITNDVELLSKADGRVRSSLSPHEIQFKPYSPLQLKKILSDRAALAFSPRACSDEVIALCAAHGAKAGGDARVALQALWFAGKNADARGSRTINLEDARSAFAKISSSRQQKRERDLQLLDDGEKKIVEFLKELGGESTTSRLYELFVQRSLGSERSVRNYVRSLEQKGIIASQEQESGKRRVRLL